MTEDPRRTLGREGEERAAAYLADRGFEILARNVRAGGVELDLVAARADLVVIVEVKTRRDARHGAPEEAVDFRKRARLARGAAAWLRGSPRRYRRVRFDVVVCERVAGAWRIRHLPGAFSAGD